MSASKVVLNILYVCVTVLVFILIAFGLLKLGTASYDMGYRVFTEPPMASAPGQDVIVEVSEGMGTLDLGKVLEEKRLVEDARIFMVQMTLSPYSKKIEPGVYTLNTSQTAREMLAVMGKASEPEEETEE